MSRLGLCYRYAQYLSLDVVLGAVLTGMMAANLLACPLPLAWWIGFPLSVWIFYTADHLIDAYRLGEQAHTGRHLFHYRHFKLLTVMVCMGLLMILWAITRSPTALLSLGMLIGIMGLIHLLLTYLFRNVVSKWLQKELGVALIYTTAVWGGPFVLTQGEVPWEYGGLFLIYFLLALGNLLIFSYQELSTDILDGHTSVGRALGPQGTYRLISFLLGGIFLGIIGQMLASEKMGAWIGASSISLGISFIFTLIHLFPSWFQQHQRYRIWGDGAFLLSGGSLLMCPPFSSLFISLSICER